MKRSLTVALMVTLVASACIPLYGQGRKKDDVGGIAFPTPTTFAITEAFTDGTGVLVKWTMAAERQNVGFNVYRYERMGSRNVDPINRAVILSSVARTGDDTATGDPYFFFDPNGDANASYFVRALGRDGSYASGRLANVQVIEDLALVSNLSAAQWLAASDSPNRLVSGGAMDLEPELAKEVRLYEHEANLQMHRWVVGQPGAKIAARKEGLYRVTSSELLAAGFDTTGDPTNWRLFVEGVEQAILIGPNNAYIEFYGKGIDTVESDIRVYYLINDTVPGKRMATRSVRPIGGGVVSENYPVTASIKERTSYVSEIRNGDLENYWGHLVSSTTSTFEFSLTGVTLSGNVEFQLKMQGYSVGTHLLEIRLNGNDLPDQTWNGYDPFSATFTIPATNLVEGENNLELTGLGPGSDFSFFDALSVKYLRRFQAEDNAASFFTYNYRRANLTGFGSANVRVFDVTRDGDPALVLNVPLQQEGLTYTAKMPSTRAFVAYAVENSAILQSQAVTRNTPSSYATSSDDADLIIISHSAPEFLSASETWANYRRGQGYTAIVVDVADLYDEYSYGSLSSAAIRNFLEHARTNWSNRPEYVLLMGDATHDPRNYENFGYWDLVPTRFVNLLLTESGSDEALADFDNDGLAELAVGRIPARNLTAIQTAFNKTTTFEPGMTLSRGAIFAFDLPFGFDFQSMCGELRDQLPGSVPNFMIGRGDPNAGTTLVNEMNNGRFIANYCGHGSLGLWASTSFFASTTVPSLTNANNPSIYTMLTCLNGYFVLPSSASDSLGEVLLKWENGGAVASWASTGKTFPDSQLQMGTRFFSKLGDGTIPRLGDLVKDAKVAIPAGPDVRLSWVLLGDPMLKVN